MCGRFALTAEQEALSVALGVPILVDGYRPRYNIAPTDETLLLVQDPGEPPRVVRQRWGFTRAPRPGSASGPLLINARSESVTERPAFRDAWRARRRCLVLADGFYEWSGERGSPGGRVPHWIHLADRRPFGFAALYEPAPAPAGGSGDRFTILTSEPNELVAPIHDRMPVILSAPEDQRAWVDRGVPPEAVLGLLDPRSPAGMREHIVTTYVNHPKHEGPACIEPVAGAGAPPAGS